MAPFKLVCVLVISLLVIIFWHMVFFKYCSLKRFYDLTMCKTYKNVLNAENIVILSVNTVTHYIVIVGL